MSTAATKMSGPVKAPAARGDLTLQEVGREGLLYDREGELIHILNATALVIWKAMDGQRDEAAIEAILRERFSGLDGHDVIGDIRALLAQLDERGLLAGGASGAGPTVKPQEGASQGPSRRA